MLQHQEPIFFFLKKKLEGPTISITENLTTKRMKTLQTAREEHRLKNVWKQDRRIMCWNVVNDRFKLYYNESVLSWHSAMLETERKNCFGFLIFYFYFALVVRFWE